MNLQQYQDQMFALLAGEVSAEATSQALFGVADETTVLRLAAYRAGYLGAQRDGLQIQHPQTRAVVVARFGEDAWRALVAEFSALHPPRNPHRVVSLQPFAAFVSQRPKLPPWLGELARLERLALMASLAPDAPQAEIEPETSVMALSYDVLAWNADGAPDLLAEPEHRDNLILTWRGPDGEPLQAEVGELDALVVRALLAGRLPNPDELEALGCGADDLAQALQALAEIGVWRLEDTRL